MVLVPLNPVPTTKRVAGSCHILRGPIHAATVVVNRHGAIMTTQARQRGGAGLTHRCCHRRTAVRRERRSGRFVDPQRDELRGVRMVHRMTRSTRVSAGVPRSR